MQSLSIVAQKYLRKCEDTYFILQNKYLRIYELTFGTKILSDDFESDFFLIRCHQVRPAEEGNCTRHAGLDFFP